MSGNLISLQTRTPARRPRPKKPPNRTYAPRQCVARNCAAVPREPALLVEKESRAASVHWFSQSPNMPNSTEVLFMALLVAHSTTNCANMVAWARRVLAQKPAAAELHEANLPKGTELEPMENAYSVHVWSDDALDKIGAVIKGWRGAGRLA
eukprot:1581996-Prymnesium_polylepis.1